MDRRGPHRADGAGAQAFAWAPRGLGPPPPLWGAGGRGAVYRTSRYGRTVAGTAPYGARPGGHGREPCLRARAARAGSRRGRLPPFEAVAESSIQQLPLKQPSTFLLWARPGGWADFTQRNKLWCGTERDGLWMSQFMRCVKLWGGVFVRACNAWPFWLKR